MGMHSINDKTAACETATFDSRCSSSDIALSVVGNGEYLANSSVDPIISIGLNKGIGDKNSLGLEDSVVAVSLDCEPAIGNPPYEPYLEPDKVVENGPFLDHLEDNQIIPVEAAIKGIKGKKKRKTINDILGFSKVNQKGGRYKEKCVVLRSAVAAAALSASISSNRIANRNRIILSEAQAIWKVNKEMGIGYEGDEEEVVSKIADMVALNKGITP